MSKKKNNKINLNKAGVMKFKIKVKITEVGISLLEVLKELVSDYDFSSKPPPHPYLPKPITTANLNKYFKSCFFQDIAEQDKLNVRNQILRKMEMQESRELYKMPHNLFGNC